MIQTGFLVSRPTQVALTASSRLPVRVFHPLRSDFPDTSGSLKCVYLALLQPPHGRDRTGLGSVPFARHYSGYRCFLPLPAGTKMFQFPTFAPDYMPGVQASPARVAPFGLLRIISCLLIPADFRSLPRPSSPPEA